MSAAPERFKELIEVAREIVYRVDEADGDTFHPSGALVAAVFRELVAIDREQAEAKHKIDMLSVRLGL